MMTQVKGWEQVQHLRDQKVEQIQQTHIDRLYHRIAARRVALGMLETVLNVIINNSIAEEMMKRFGKPVVALPVVQAEKKTSRRTYYCVPDKFVDGKLGCKIYGRKPAHENYLKVSASNYSGAREICDKAWNREAA